MIGRKIRVKQIRIEERKYHRSHDAHKRIQTKLNVAKSYGETGEKHMAHFDRK